MIELGSFRISAPNHGFYKLDGGAVFGVVPKPIWSRLLPPDDENRVLFAVRSLLVETGDRRILVDTGNGNKWTEKMRRIYAFEETPGGAEAVGPVTDVILTHLHFDHAGGISRLDPAAPNGLALCFPDARINVQADNFETARRPNARERGSYFPENVAILERARLALARGSSEIAPGVWVHPGNGHTRGHQWVEVRTADGTVAFPSDLIPTSHHVPLPYTLGFDMAAEALLAEKEEFLGRAVAEDWIVVFTHDPDVPAARLGRDERGRYGVREVVAL